MISAASTSALSLVSSTPQAVKATAVVDPSLTILASVNGVTPEVDGSKRNFAGTVFNASMDMRNAEAKATVGPGGGLVLRNATPGEAVATLRGEIDAVEQGRGTFGLSVKDLESLVQMIESTEALTGDILAAFDSPEQEAARARSLKASAEDVITAYNEHRTFMSQLLKAGLITEDRTGGLDEAYAYNKGIYDELMKAGY